LRVKLTRDHLSAISGITLDGRLFLQIREQTYDSAAVVGFLRVLLRKIPGKLLVIWDGSPIHKGQPIKDFLKRGAAKRLQLERLPGTHLTSIRTRASGAISNASSSATSAVPT
jgi:hypothetical protein